jgi:hypothetical protein
MQVIGCRNLMMHQSAQELQVTNTDRANVIFLLRHSPNNLSLAEDNLVNPILKISEEARMYLTFSQRVSIENAFSLRSAILKKFSVTEGRTGSA